MSTPLPTIPADPGSGAPAHRRHRTPPWFLVAAVMLMAAMIPSAAHLIGAKQSVRAQDTPRNQANAPATAVADASGFIAEFRQVLKQHQDRMAPIAASTLSMADTMDSLRDQMLNHKIAIERAKMTFQDAKVSREIAEIELTGYKFGIVAQELATADGELKLAQDELERAKANTAESKMRLGRIARYANESASSLNLVYIYTDHLKADELREIKAGYVIEQAVSKKKILVEYTHPTRLKEMEADIEKERSDELSRHAELDLEMSKLQKIQRSIKSNEPSPDERQVLALLDQAIQIEEQVVSKVEQLAGGGKADPALQKEIVNLANQLRNLADRVEAAHSAARYARLKPKIHQSAQQYPVARPK